MQLMINHPKKCGVKLFIFLFALLMLCVAHKFCLSMIYMVMSYNVQ